MNCFIKSLENEYTIQHSLNTNQTRQELFDRIESSKLFVCFESKQFSDNFECAELFNFARKSNKNLIRVNNEQERVSLSFLKPKYKQFKNFDNQQCQIRKVIDFYLR